MIATLFAVLALTQAASTTETEPTRTPAKSRSERLLELHRGDAEAYTMFRDAERHEKLALVREPVYRWTNPTRNDGQEGDVFVWTYHGRPEAVGCIFSHPADGKRAVNHEFHSLSPVILYPEHPGKNQWQPKAPGINWRPIDAPEPGATHAARRTQLAAIVRGFSAESYLEGPPVRLRLLPHPLYHYESDGPDLAEGSLFAYVTSAGTDPEILLLIEAHNDDSKLSWHFSGARFSDWALRIKYQGKEVWSSPTAAIGGYTHDEQHRYRFYGEKIIDEVVEPLGSPK